MPARLVLAAHRFALGTARGRGAGVWSAAYRALARGVAAIVLFRLPQATAYARGSIAGDDLLPGVSDADLVVVTADGASAPVERRWQRLWRMAGPLRELVSVAVYEEGELARLGGQSALTYRGPAVFFGPHPARDQLGLLARPGLQGDVPSWERLAGRERRMPVRERTRAEERVAAWLELQRWWSYAAPACARPRAPRTPYLAVKLVAEPARALLWLRHGERFAGRREVLERALSLLPGHEESLRVALDLHDRLHDPGAVPLAAVVEGGLALTGDVAALLVREAFEEGATPVGLRHDPALGLALPAGAQASVPLVDWRAVVSPPSPDQALAPLDAAVSPESLVAAGRAAGAVRPVLRHGSLMLLPAHELEAAGLMRSVQQPASDPVSFALLTGEDTAAFPESDGWSAESLARRAVEELGAWLRREAVDPAVPARELGTLIMAARAAMFAESVADGEPELALTVADAVAGLADRMPGAEGVASEALAAYRAWRGGERVDVSAVFPALRDVVEALPGFAVADQLAGRAP